MTIPLCRNIKIRSSFNGVQDERIVWFGMNG